MDLQLCTKHALPQLQNISKETYIDTYYSEPFRHINSLENVVWHTETAFASEQLLAELAQPDSLFYFAMVDNQIAGYVKLNRLEAQTASDWHNALEIERIYIVKAMQNKGIGKFLINECQRIAKNLAAQQLWLGVWENNDNAIKFYEKQGFTKAGTKPFVLGKEKQLDFIMLKHLQ